MKIKCKDGQERLFATPIDSPYLCLMCGDVVSPYRPYAEQHVCVTNVRNEEVIERYRRTGKIKLERRHQ